MLEIKIDLVPFGDRSTTSTLNTLKIARQSLLPLRIQEDGSRINLYAWWMDFDPDKDSYSLPHGSVEHRYEDESAILVNKCLADYLTKKMLRKAYEEGLACGVANSKNGRPAKPKRGESDRRGGKKVLRTKSGSPARKRSKPSRPLESGRG